MYRRAFYCLSMGAYDDYGFAVLSTLARLSHHPYLVGPLSLPRHGTPAWLSVSHVAFRDDIWANI